MLMDQSGTDLSMVRPIAPPKFGSGIGSLLRSGLNLPIASAREPCELAEPDLVGLHHRPHGRALPWPARSPGDIRHRRWQ